MSAAEPRPGVFDEHLARRCDRTRGLTRAAMEGTVRLLRDLLAGVRPSRVNPLPPRRRDQP